MTLDAARIAALLTTSRYGRSLDVRARTASTNDDARAAADRDAPDGHVVVADAQDTGRGAHGHAWSSAPGTDLYLSIVARPTLPVADLPLVTLATGLGVHACVEGCLSSQPAVRLKWPNDLLVDDRKCAGILVETSSLGDRIAPLVIGIGLNVNRIAFDAELADATSLSLVTGRASEREAVLASLLVHVERWIDVLTTRGPQPIVAALSNHLAWRGERVTCGEIVGMLRGIDARGALLIDDHHVTSGTVRRVDAP